VAASPQTTWLADHKTAVQWGVVLFGGLVLVAWNNPTAGVVLIDAILIAIAAMSAYPLTEARFREIVREVAERRAGGWGDA